MATVFKQQKLFLQSSFCCCFSYVHLELCVRLRSIKKMRSTGVCVCGRLPMCVFRLCMYPLLDAAAVKEINGKEHWAAAPQITCHMQLLSEGTNKPVPMRRRHGSHTCTPQLDKNDGWSPPRSAGNWHRKQHAEMLAFRECREANAWPGDAEPARHTGRLILSLSLQNRQDKSSVNLCQRLASLCETDITCILKRNLIMNEHSTWLMFYMLDYRLNATLWFFFLPLVSVSKGGKEIETMLEKTSSHPLWDLWSQCTNFFLHKNPGLWRLG